MATYTLTAGQVAKHAFQLTADTVDTVVFPAALLSIEIISNGIAAAYFTIDGTTPTVAGANTYLLPAGVTSIDLRTAVGNVDAITTIKIISAGTPTISVQQGAIG